MCSVCETALRNQLLRYELPDEVLVWAELPVTGTGKISKKDIRQKLADDGYKLPDLRKSKL